jgi:hypothetical protein
VAAFAVYSGGGHWMSRIQVRKYSLLASSSCKHPTGILRMFIKASALLPVLIFECKPLIVMEQNRWHGKKTNGKAKPTDLNENSKNQQLEQFREDPSIST